MKTDKIIKMGSGVFFDKYPDYIVHDRDELHLIDPDDFPLEGVSWRLHNIHTVEGDRDIILYKNISKEEMIDDCRKAPIKLGKLLIPEYVEYIGLTINELKELEDAFNRLDSKHRYEKIIWESYIENGDFYLTDEQRLHAYEEYKSERKEIYSNQTKS